MYIGLHANYPFLLSEFNEARIFSTYFGRYSNIEFHGNRSSGNPVVPCGLTAGRAEAHDEGILRRSLKIVLCVRLLVICDPLKRKSHKSFLVLNTLDFLQLL
jgi:hypothetical protein